MAPDTLSLDALPANVAEGGFVLDEMAEAAAPVARELALHHCRTDPATGESCAWYHGYRLYKSILSRRTAENGRRQSGGWTESHAAFYRSAFGALAQVPGFHRVLVSGSSDYMMPSLVYDAYRRENAPVALTVVDICETPLRLCEWYADQRGFTLRTHHSDIFDYKPEQPFDALCTHHFLNFIAPDRREALFEGWREMLRPGGRAVIVNSVRPGGPCESAGEYSAEGTDRFITAVREARRAARFPFPSDQELIEVLINRDSRKQFKPVQSADEIADQMAAAGFFIERVEQLDSNFAAVQGASRVPRKKGTFGLVAIAH